MPLPNGTLTDEEYEMVTTKLNAIWNKLPDGKPPCRSCGSQEFFFHPALIGNRSDTLSPTEKHTRIPTVMIYCKECGHAEHFVARVLGVEVLLTEADKKNG